MNNIKAGAILGVCSPTLAVFNIYQMVITHDIVMRVWYALMLLASIVLIVICCANTNRWHRGGK